MKYSALIGNPTGHSVSHIMYGELAKAANIEYTYQHIRVDIDKDELKQSLEAFKTIRFAGLNVTLPYKLDIMKYLDELDPVIGDLGAVNTIKLGKTTIGYNTDWVGIVESIRKFGNLGHYETVTIFGTGGAARAAIYACRQLGVKGVNVLYRTEASDVTRELQEHCNRLGVTLHRYADIGPLVDNSQLVINATSAGMVGKEPLPFELEMIKDISLKDKVFLDAVFNPLETPLLAYFKQQGATVIDGLWMMIYQGIKSLSIWLDCKVVVSEEDLTRIHHILEKELSKNV